MPKKIIELDPIGKITITKKSKNKHLRLSISTNGEVKVSIPNWAPYISGINFALSKLEWINKSRTKKAIIVNNQQIGRSHHIFFKSDNLLEKPKARLCQNQIIISYPPILTLEDDKVQLEALKASIKALRRQAEILLPQRLEYLSKTTKLEYNLVNIKQLSRRWGSCDQSKNIIFNLFLIQLPWELIDYVIMHELSHTKHLNHGDQFWKLLESITPNAKQLKKQLNSYHPSLIEA